MTTNTKEELYALFDEHNCRSARITHQECRGSLGNTTVFVWFVDNDDDRFIEIRDSFHGTDFLIVFRDGKEAIAMVVDKSEDCIVAVKMWLSRWAARGQRSKSGGAL